MADVGSNPLLDLSFLSEEEREKIERVLKADQALQLKNTVCSRQLDTQTGELFPSNKSPVASVDASDLIRQSLKASEVNQHIGNGEHKPSPAQKIPSAEHSDSGEETDEMDEMDEMDKMDEMDEMDEMEGQDKASLPAMTFMKRKVSTASVTSMYSAACGKGDYEISGKILLGVWHKEEQLFVRVTRAKKLAAAKDDGVSDPYIETHLLPDKSKQTKRKTTVQKKTLDPVYDEILKYKLPRVDVKTRTLWLSVWDWDQFGSNQFLGEVRLPLSSLDLTDSKDHWYTLKEMENSTEDEENFYHGKVSIALKFSSPREVNEENKHLVIGTLHVLIKQARELPVMDANGLTDATVRCFLLPNISTTGKRKTRVVKNDLNPVWEEEFTYKNVTLEQLSKERVLEVTIWDYDRRGSNDFIGGLHLGPTPSSAAENKEWMDSIHEEVSHWEAMLACPGEWVQRWHTLRPSMDPRASPSRKLSPTYEEETSSPREQSRTPSPNETKPIASGKRPGQLDSYRGELKLGLKYTPSGSTKDGKIKGSVCIAVKKARNLPKMDIGSLTDGYVQCYLLPDRSWNGKRKTKVINNNLDPVWDEQLTYEKVVFDDLSRERVLEVTVWDYDFISFNDFIGGIRLGPDPANVAERKEWMDSAGDEISHWEAMLAQPGEWVEQWHTLRPSMDPRGSNFSTQSAPSTHPSPPVPVVRKQETKAATPPTKEHRERPSPVSSSPQHKDNAKNAVREAPPTESHPTANGILTHPHKSFCGPQPKAVPTESQLTANHSIHLRQPLPRSSPVLTKAPAWWLQKRKSKKTSLNKETETGL